MPTPTHSHISGRSITHPSVSLYPPTTYDVHHIWLANDTTFGFSFPADAAKMDDFVDHATDSWATRGDVFQTNQPNGKALMYLNFGVTNIASGGVYSSFLEQAAARASGYLATSAGSEISNPFGGTGKLLDVGKSGVKEAMVADMRSRPNYSNWNGVFLDDVNTWSNTSAIDGYASPTIWWNNAALPALSYISDQLAIDGKVALPNLGGYPTDLDAIVRDAWSYSNHGVFAEFAGCSANGVAQDNKSLENIYAGCRAAIEGGKTYYGMIHPPTSGALNAQYAKYAFCLQAIFGGDLPKKMRVSVQPDNGSTALIWDAVYETVLGLPTGAVTHTTSTATWQRVFGNAAGGSKTVSIDISTCTGTIV